MAIKDQKVQEAVFVEKEFSKEEQEAKKIAFMKKVSELAEEELKKDKDWRIIYDYDNCIRIFAWLDFSDLRFSEDEMVLENHSWETKYDLVGFDFKKLQEDLNTMMKEIGTNNKVWGKYFSFHLPMKKWNETFLQGFRWLLKVSVNGNEMTIRKLTTPRKFEDSIADPKLVEGVIKGVLSRKWVVISGKTGSGKSTTFITILNHFNNSNYTDILLKKIWELIFQKLRTISGTNWQTEKFIKSVYNSLENLKIIAMDVKYCLEVIKMKIFKEYSKRWELLTANNIIKVINKYLSESKNPKVQNWGEIIVRMFEEFNDYFTNELLQEELKPINQAIKKFSTSKLRNVTTLEEPIEFVYWKEGILRFYQHSLSQHFNGQYFEFINQILRDNPHICFIAESRNSEEIDTFLTSMSLGITSLTTCHSYDSFEALMKFIDLSSKGKGEVMNIITNSFSTGINIEAYFFRSLREVGKLVNGFIQWYDYLQFTPDMAISFRNYYLQNDLVSFAEQYYNWKVDHATNKLNYYPKKYTLNYRLMVLWEVIQSKLPELEWPGKFNLNDFMEELSDLLYNNKAFLNEWDMMPFSLIYGNDDMYKMRQLIQDWQEFNTYRVKESLV